MCDVALFGARFGTELIGCDCDVPHLLLGLTNGRWGSIVAEE
jgi:hypothetical protein